MITTECPLCTGIARLDDPLEVLDCDDCGAIDVVDIAPLVLDAAA